MKKGNVYIIVFLLLMIPILVLLIDLKYFNKLQSDLAVYLLIIFITLLFVKVIIGLIDSYRNRSTYRNIKKKELKNQVHDLGPFVHYSKKERGDEIFREKTGNKKLTIAILAPITFFTRLGTIIWILFCYDVLLKSQSLLILVFGIIFLSPILVFLIMVIFFSIFLMITVFFPESVFYENGFLLRTFGVLKKFYIDYFEIIEVNINEEERSGRFGKFVVDVLYISTKRGKLYHMTSRSTSHINKLENLILENMSKRGFSAIVKDYIKK